jgi:fermentation-respiration switch protein FrsA (DUF1100 family)
VSSSTTTAPRERRTCGWRAVPISSAPSTGSRRSPRRPLLISQNAVAKAGPSVELFLIESATHVDLYDRDPYVAPAVDKLTAFFKQHL